VQKRLIGPGITVAVAGVRREVDAIHDVARREVHDRDVAEPGAVARDECGARVAGGPGRRDNEIERVRQVAGRVLEERLERTFRIEPLHVVERESVHNERPSVLDPRDRVAADDLDVVLHADPRVVAHRDDGDLADRPLQVGARDEIPSPFHRHERAVSRESEERRGPGHPPGAIQSRPFEIEQEAGVSDADRSEESGRQGAAAVRAAHCDLRRRLERLRDAAGADREDVRPRLERRVAVVERCLVEDHLEVEIDAAIGESGDDDLGVRVGHRHVVDRLQARRARAGQGIDGRDAGSAGDGRCHGQDEEDQNSHDILAW